MCALALCAVTSAIALACDAKRIPNTSDANKGVFYRLALANIDHVQETCNAATDMFTCEHVFETGVFGTQHVSSKDVLQALGQGAQGPGSNYKQDATEGELHPHNAKDTPSGLANVVNLAGREVTTSTPGTQARRALKSAFSTATEQENAPFYLGFLQQEERSSCERGGGPQHACLGTDVFRVSHSGKGVTIYFVGEDVSRVPAEMEPRISSDKFVGERISAHHEFCEDWQGTHMASLAAGAHHGVAKEAVIVPVAVKPGCRIEGPILDLLRGLQWVIDRRRERADSPAVLVMSTKFAVSQQDTVALSILEDLVRVLTNDLQVTVVAAGGANAIDAAHFSPGRMHEVITVGGLEVYKEVSMGEVISTVWLASNYGNSIDLWAPAAYIDAAYPLDSNSTATYSGVPQAAALVAGVAASLLHYNPQLTPEDVKRELRIRSSENLMIMTRPRNTQNVLQIPTDWANVYMDASQYDM